MKPPTLTQFLFKHFKGFKLWISIMIILPVISGLVVAFGQYAIKIFIDMALTPENVGLHLVIGYSIVFLIVRLNDCWVFHFIGISFKRIIPMLGNIGKDMYTYVSDHSYRFFQDNFSGSVASKISQMQNRVGDIFFRVNLWCVFYVGFTIILISSIHVLFGLICFIWVAIMTYLFLFLFSGKMSALNMEKQSTFQKYTGKLNDLIMNIFTVKAFSTKKYEQKNIIKLNNEVLSKIVNIWNYRIWKQNLIARSIETLFVIAILLLMIFLRYHNKITIGSVLFIITTLPSLIRTTHDLIDTINSFIDYWSEIKSCYSIMEIEHEVKDSDDAVDHKIKQGKIELKNIRFFYDAEENKIFKNFSLTIPQNQKIGIVGTSGSGKTTLINLIMRYFDIQSGEILIDGLNIKEMTQESLRSQIAIIPQDTTLFHVSLMENIRYGNLKAKDAEVIEASRKANTHDFIERLPDKYNTLVGERGVKLSGGQKQRIAIARAILKNAPILVLDEATSSLDSQTEQQIQESIDTMLATKSATVVVIAHRLSTIKNLDRIIVLDGGQVIEDGNFQKLLANKNSKFREMWDRQADGMIAKKKINK
jgi:ATP-binding cassette, subfamily B, bacterial